MSASQPETLPIEKHQLFLELANEAAPVTAAKPTSASKGKGGKPVREPIKQ